MNRLLLIDGNAIMHRAYHAMPPLTSPEGKPVQVVYGFVSMLLKLYDNLAPTHVAVAFDRPGPTFRNKLFTEYQAQRPEMDDDFISQIPIVHDVVSSFGIPFYEADGFEADDVIGTICKQVHRQQKADTTEKIDQVVIVTGDRDILQLVEDEKVLVFMPKKGLAEGKIYSEHDVVERMGVKPSQIADMKALMGDSSDNYPGVAGIGPKTAEVLIRRFTTLEQLYANIHDDIAVSDISPSVVRKLRAGAHQAILSKQLSSIRKDVPIVYHQSSVVSSLNTTHIRKKLEELHFYSLIHRLSSGKKSVQQIDTKQKQRKHSVSEQQHLL